MDYQSRILPFYLSGVYPHVMQEENSVRRDLEYLEQLYPAQAKKLQSRIASILDTMDYEGSMLYDEYPDKWQLYKLQDSILCILKKEAEEAEEGKEVSEAEWEWIKDMVQLLLCHEIYCRRHGRRRTFLKF